jgi:BirA family transcriptional regulator, biotin operon repressor / biotin---[acetyl-CoA-carboxylase] ligase
MPSNFPWLIELPTCASTNTFALQHYAALSHGACIYTPEQTAGRGRDGRTWRSPPGVLTASFVLQVRDQMMVTQLALAAGLAVAHAVEDLPSTAENALKNTTQVQLKWPNDCFIAGKKLAGILCERPDGSGVVVVGIGLNVDPRWDQVRDGPALAPHTANIAEITGHAPSMYELMHSLRRYLLEAVGLLTAGGWTRLLPHLRTRDYLLGKQVEIQHDGLRHRGQALGLDDYGNLRVQTTTGIITAMSGHVVVE